MSYFCGMGGGFLRCPTFVEWMKGVYGVLLLWNGWKESKVSYFCGMGGKCLRCPTRV